MHRPQTQPVWATRIHPKPKKQKTKVSQRMQGQFCFFGFLFFWFFRFLVFTLRKHKNQKNKNPKNQKSKKKQKSKNPKKQNCSGILRETLFFCFFGFGSSVALDRRNQGSNSIPLEKHEVAGGGGVLKGLVCHGGGGVTIYIYVYTYVYMSVRVYISIHILNSQNWRSRAFLDCDSCGMTQGAF